MKVDGLIIPAANKEAEAKILRGLPRALRALTASCSIPSMEPWRRQLPARIASWGAVAFDRSCSLIVFKRLRRPQADRRDIAQRGPEQRILGSIRKQLVTADERADIHAIQPAKARHRRPGTENGADQTVLGSTESEDRGKREVIDEE